MHLLRLGKYQLQHYPVLHCIIQPCQRLQAFKGNAYIHQSFIGYASLFSITLFLVSCSAMRLVSLILSSMGSLICKVDKGLLLPLRMRKIFYCCRDIPSSFKKWFIFSCSQLPVKIIFTVAF